jgi:hypothetical protein
MYHVPRFERPAGRQLLWWWGASFLGGSIAGGLLFVPVWWTLTSSLMVDLDWIVGATAVGIAQSLVLSADLRTRSWWIAVTVLGATLYVGLLRLGAWMVQQDQVRSGSLLPWLVSSAIAMLVLGLCQTAVLDESYRRVGWWGGAAVLGGLMTTLAEHGVASHVSGYGITSMAQGLLISMLIMGVRWLILTAWMGIALVTLLRPRADTPALPSRDTSYTTAKNTYR